MDNHDEKEGFLREYQSGRCMLSCPGCPRIFSMINKGRLTLDHIFEKSREGKAGARWEEDFKQFGDSLVNLRLLPLECNVNIKGRGKRYTREEALIFERILRAEKFGAWTYGDVLNMRSDLSYVDIVSVYEDVMNKFEEEKK